MSAMNYVSMTQGALIAELLERDGECVTLSAENKIMREAFRTILDGHKDIASRRVAADTLNAVSSMNDETYVNVDELLRENKRLFAENSAAKKMRNEIVGLCSLGEHHMREFAGNTNYNCLIDAVKEFDRVSTEPAPDGINDRGSDEYANPDDTQQLPDEGNTWQCSKCGKVNAGAYCPCSYEVMDDEPVGDRHAQKEMK